MWHQNMSSIGGNTGKYEQDSHVLIAQAEYMEVHYITYLTF